MKVISQAIIQAINPAALSLRGGGSSGGGSAGIEIAEISQAANTHPVGITDRVTITPPASTQAGDLLVAIIFADNGSTEGNNPVTSTPAGWTFVAQYGSNKPPSVKPAAFYKVAGSDEGAVTFVTPGSSQKRHSGFILRITGADTDAPINSFDGNYTTTWSSTFSTESITTTAADTLVLKGITMDDLGSGGRLPPVVTASAFELVGEIYVRTASGSGYDNLHSYNQLYATVIPAPGASGSIGFDFTATNLGSNACESISLSINPAS